MAMIMSLSPMALSIIVLFIHHLTSCYVQSFSARPLFTKNAVQPSCRCRHQPTHQSNLLQSSSTVLFSTKARGERGSGRHYDYSQIGDRGAIDPSICKLDSKEIHRLIRQRTNHRRSRDYSQADEILKELNANGIHVDDRRKEWRADGIKYFGKNGRVYFRFGDCQTIEDAAQLAFDNLDSISHSNLSAFWTTVSKLLPNSQRRQQGVVGSAHRLDQLQLTYQLDSIFSRTMENIGRYEMKDLTQTTLAFAKIANNVRKNHRRGGKSHDIEGSSCQILDNIFTDQKRDIFESTANAACPQLSQFDGRHLSNFAYAYALADVVPKVVFEDGSTLFGRIANESIPLLDTFTPQDFSNIVWAFTKAGGSGVSHPRFIREVGDAIVSMGDEDLLNGFNEQALSNILWSFAKSKVSHTHLFEKVAGTIVSSSTDLDRFKPQALANIVWAFAKAEVSHPRLFEKVAHAIISADNLDKFKTQELSNLLWAFAKSGIEQPHLFAKAAEVITTPGILDGCKPQSLSIVAWSYAKAEEHHPHLFENIAKAAQDMQCDFNAQAMANLLWAFAKAGHIDANLFLSLAPMATSLLPEFNRQALTNIAWAYAVADVNSDTLFNDSFVSACLDKKNGKLTIQGLNQLYQWHLWQEEELASDVGLPPKLLMKCYERFPSDMPRSSALKDDVVSCLASIGLEPEADFLTLRGYRLDALIQVNGNKVGVEVDGPPNFMGRSPNGRTILKRRQVSNLEGMPLVSVPYWEWNNFGDDRSGKERYLQSIFWS